MPVALVTGASRGIGRAIAQTLSQKGWRVAVNCIKSEKEAQALALQLRAHAPAIAVQADVSIPEAVGAMVQKVRAQLGPIDLLVNNAGVSAIELFQDTTPEKWRALMDVNLSGAFYCAQAVLPDMLANQRGCIINISSMWGQVGASCEVAYSAAKAGLIGLTKALAKELGPSGIRVNCVTPGIIDTDMNRHLDAPTLSALKEETPLGRLGAAQDVADTVAFLAGPDASFITGQVIGVSGGLVI